MIPYIFNHLGLELHYFTQRYLRPPLSEFYFQYCQLVEVIILEYIKLFFKILYQWKYRICMGSLAEIKSLFDVSKI